MDNHVHLIAVPKHETSFADGFSESHKRYTKMINLREGWRGHLWEGRFKSYPLNEAHLYAAMKYVERNPVRAKMVKKAWQYPWSSAKAHVDKLNPLILDDCFFSQEMKDWAGYISEEDEDKDIIAFRKHSRTGRPLGDKKFIDKLEKTTGRRLYIKKPGRKKKDRK
jgi:putative transposase